MALLSRSLSLACMTKGLVATVVIVIIGNEQLMAMRYEEGKWVIVCIAL